MTSRSRVGRGVIVALTLTLVACASAHPAGASGVHLTAADGTVTTLASLRGRGLVVNLWATWCHPCVAEMPVFEQVSKESAAFSVVGVNIGDDAAAATAFASTLGVRYPQYTDVDGALEAALGVSNLPATAFIAADGTLLSVHTGAFTATDLRAAIRQQFGEQSLGADTNA
jgi:thiol-disulfide isomerase/thioredoxin